MHGHCTPLKWDAHKQRLDLCKKLGVKYYTRKVSWEQQKFSILLLIHRLAVGTLVGQHIIAISKPCPMATRIMDWLSVLILVAYHIHLCVINRKPQIIVSFVNGLFQFQGRMKEHSSERKRSFTENMNVLFAAAMPPLAFIIPVGYVFGLHLFHPYGRPSLIGYWLLGNDATSHGLFLRLLVFFLNYWMWSVGTLAGIFGVGGLQCLCTIYLRDCVNSFWNMEARNNDSTFVKRSKIYREIQLLGNLQECIQAGALMMLLMFAPIVTVSLSSVVVLKLPWITENAVIIAFSAYICIVCVTCMIFVVGSVG